MIGFSLDASNILKNLVEKEVKTMAALALYADTVTKDMEGYAKTNREWTDRTSHARNALNGNVQDMGNAKRCNISHGVDYGIYLEICNEGKYAILEETVDNISPKAFKGLDKIFK